MGHHGEKIIEVNGTWITLMFFETLLQTQNAMSIEMFIDLKIRINHMGMQVCKLPSFDPVSFHYLE